MGFENPIKANQWRSEWMKNIQIMILLNLIIQN
jgi:hypothetical protein